MLLTPAELKGPVIAGEPVERLAEAVGDQRCYKGLRTPHRERHVAMGDMLPPMAHQAVSDVHGHRQVNEVGHNRLQGDALALQELAVVDHYTVLYRLG